LRASLRSPARVKGSTASSLLLLPTIGKSDYADKDVVELKILYSGIAMLIVGAILGVAWILTLDRRYDDQ